MPTRQMTLDEACDLFMARNAQRPPHTRRAHEQDLASLTPWIEREAGVVASELAVRSITPVMAIRAFAGWAHSRPPTRQEAKLAKSSDPMDYALSTQARVQSTWSRLFQLLVLLEEVDRSPMIAMDRVTPGKRAPKPLEHHGDTGETGTIPRLVAYIDSPAWENDVSVAWRERDLLIIQILLALGVRSSELLGLRVGTFDGPPLQAKATILGKGDKERVLDVPEQLMEAQRSYMRSRRDRFASWKPADSDMLLVAVPRGAVPIGGTQSGGTPLTSGQLDYLLSKALSGAGVAGRKPKGALAHAFRHTFGTVMAETTPMPALAEIMGHASLETTKGYTEVSDGVRRRALNQNPLLGLTRPGPVPS